MNCALILVLLVGAVTCQDTINTAIVNSEVERTLDATTQLLKLTELITLEAAGGSSTSSFLYFIEPTLQNHLAYIEARVS
jgi:oligosaccharyltransferase complex subunit alpha (ribophorin I)